MAPAPLLAPLWGLEGPCANVLTASLCSPEPATRTKRVPFLHPLFFFFNISLSIIIIFFFCLTPCIVNLTGFGFWRAKPKREQSLSPSDTSQ